MKQNPKKMKKAKKQELFQTKKLEKIKDFLATVQQGERQDILSLLIEKGTLKASEIHHSIGIEQSKCSTHLKQLKQYGLVTDKRDGRTVYYSVNEENLNKAQILINQIHDSLPK